MKPPVSPFPQSEIKKIWLLTGQLTLSEPSDYGGEFSITSFPFEVGRRPDAACSLSSSEVSNYHAHFSRLDTGAWFVYDAKTKNGTFVDGKRLTGSVVLAEDVSIRFGQARCRFLSLKGIVDLLCRTPAA